MRVNCGTVGISNLTKRHRGTKKCLELKARRDKKGKGMVQGSLLTFMKPKPTSVHRPEERWHGDDVIISLLGIGA